MKRLILSTLAMAAASGVAPAYAHDYPTIDRVEYVQDCMRNNPGPRQEMLYKCSCALDAIAGIMSYDEFVEASTAANAMSIGGERGGVIRDAKMGQDLAAKFRAAQTKAKKGCFIN